MPLGNSLTVTIDFWRARAPSSWVALHDFQDRRRQKRLTKCAAFKVGDRKWKKNKFLPLSWLVRLLFGWAGKSKSKSALLSDVLYIHDILHKWNFNLLGQRSRYDESEEVCVMEILICCIDYARATAIESQIHLGPTSETIWIENKNWLWWQNLLSCSLSGQRNQAKWANRKDWPCH